MGIARLLITSDLLREVLNFPDGTVFLNAGKPDNDLYGNTVEFIVEHPDIDDASVPIGGSPPLVRPTFRKQRPVVFEDWNQA